MSYEILCEKSGIFGIKILNGMLTSRIKYTERTEFCWRQNFAGYLKIILLNHQNNFVGILKILNNAAESFDILAISLSVLRNYFDGLTKLFSDLYPAKIWDLSAKLFFPCGTFLIWRQCPQCHKHEMRIARKYIPNTFSREEDLFVSRR